MPSYLLGEVVMKMPLAERMSPWRMGTESTWNPGPRAPSM